MYNLVIQCKCCKRIFIWRTETWLPSAAWPNLCSHCTSEMNRALATEQLNATLERILDSVDFEIDMAGV